MFGLHKANHFVQVTHTVLAIKGKSFVKTKLESGQTYKDKQQQKKTKCISCANITIK